MNVRIAMAMMVLLASCRPEPGPDESGGTPARPQSPVTKIQESFARPATSFVAETTLVALIERTIGEWQSNVETRPELELLRMSGRYVETHPAGEHWADALEIVRSQLKQMAELEPTRPLCGEAADAQGVRPEDLGHMRKVLETAAAVDHAKAGTALAALERLEQRCR